MTQRLGPIELDSNGEASGEVPGGVSRLLDSLPPVTESNPHLIEAPRRPLGRAPVLVGIPSNAAGRNPVDSLEGLAGKAPRERIHYTLSDAAVDPTNWTFDLHMPSRALETKARGIIEAAGIPYRGRVHARLHAVLSADGWMPLEAERLIQREVREALRVVDWVTTGKTERDSQ